MTWHLILLTKLTHAQTYSDMCLYAHTCKINAWIQVYIQKSTLPCLMHTYTQELCACISMYINTLQTICESMHAHNIVGHIYMFTYICISQLFILLYLICRANNVFSLCLGFGFLGFFCIIFPMCQISMWVWYLSMWKKENQQLWIYRGQTNRNVCSNLIWKLFSFFKI